uniref:Putative cysteine desulfurase n=1 Tax=termite gut metagenome TaxID=433724 RepID=S0DG27_9ZZZZ
MNVTNHSGRRAAALLEDARHRLAAAVGATPREVVFTSGGTEADNLALRGAAALGAAAGKRHLIASAIEHHAVLRTLEALAEEGFSVTLLPPGADGVLPAEAVAGALREDTALVSVMLANNELGTLQPVARLAALCRARGALLHTDAVQAVGQVPVSFAGLGADMLSLSAHKFGGPRGAGALLCREGLRLPPMLRGGGQENGRRAGTEHLEGAVGMAAALKAACGQMEENAARVGALRRRLCGRLLSRRGVEIRLLGHPQQRLPGIAAFLLPGMSGEEMLLRLDLRGICVSAGAACATGEPGPSHVLEALGIPARQAQNGLRVSFGAGNTVEEADAIAEAILGVLEGAFWR